MALKAVIGIVALVLVTNIALVLSEATENPTVVNITTDTTKSDNETSNEGNRSCE